MNVSKRVILNRSGGGTPAIPSFRIRVKTDNAGTSGTNQFTIPITTGTYLYDYTTSDGQSGTGLTGSTTITFASGAGTYDINITGLFPEIYFNNTGDRLKLLKVLEWGSYGVGETSHANSFRGCSNLDEIASDIDFLNSATVCNNMFFNCNLTTLPSTFSLASVTSASLMFGNCNLTSLPAGMTLPLLQNGASMFSNCSLTDLPAGMTLSALNSAGGFLFNNTINTVRYSQLINDLESGNANNNVIFHGGNSNYNSSASAAHTTLTTAPRNWTITDSGLVV